MKQLYLLSPLLLLPSCNNGTKKVEKPNVLIIVADDAGYNDFGFMGSEEILTPNIDALSANGTVFTDAHVAATVSSPSRAMLMSGQYGQRFGYECNAGHGEGLPKDVTLIPAILKKVGYKTACIGKWHLGDLDFQHPNVKGFDTFYGLIGGARNYFYRPKKDDRDGSTNQYQYNGKGQPFDGYFTDELARRASEYIKSVGDTPFMMDLSFTAPHSPNQATKEDLAKFKKHPRQVLAAMMYGLDRGIGEVVKTLKETGKFDNTIIFFMSDNGGSTTNNSCNLPLKGFKGNKFEGGHRVPFFVVYGDNYKNDKRFNGLTSSLDVFATVADLLNLTSEQLGKKLDGVSLIPYLEGKKTGDPHEFLCWRKMNTSAIRKGDYKLIMTKGVDSVLYNIAAELNEMTDLSQKEPAKYKELMTDFQQFEKANFIEPLWIENGWAPITDGIHEKLMHNKIVTQDDYHRLNRIERQKRKAKK